jgi:hypothetical protein
MRFVLREEQEQSEKQDMVMAMSSVEAPPVL